MGFRRWREARRARLDRVANLCSSHSGVFFGYACGRKRGHGGRHKALVSRTVTNGFETERREATWD